MRPLAFLLLFSCGSVRSAADERRFCVVDADSGQAVSGAKITRFASQWQPRILLPPGKFWFPGGERTTDASGLVTFYEVAWDDRYYIEATGYERATVTQDCFRWKVRSESSQNKATVLSKDGCCVVPLQKAK